MKLFTNQFLLLILLPILSIGFLHAEEIEVAGYSFLSPEKWVSSTPTSKMRKAQFNVPGEDGRDAEVAFFILEMEAQVELRLILIVGWDSLNRPRVRL